MFRKILIIICVTIVLIGCKDTKIDTLQLEYEDFVKSNYELNLILKEEILEREEIQLLIKKSSELENNLSTKLLNLEESYNQISNEQKLSLIYLDNIQKNIKNVFEYNKGLSVAEKKLYIKNAEDLCIIKKSKHEWEVIFYNKKDGYVYDWSSNVLLYPSQIGKVHIVNSNLTAIITSNNSWYNMIIYNFDIDEIIKEIDRINTYSFNADNTMVVCTFSNDNFNNPEILGSTTIGVKYFDIEENVEITIDTGGSDYYCTNISIGNNIINYEKIFTNGNIENIVHKK